MDAKVLERYDSKEGADSYSEKFDRKLTERINDWNERRLLRRLLDEVPEGGTVLDMPCGCARLFPYVRELADRAVEGDWGFEMLRNAREANERRDLGALGYVRGNALEMPFRTGAVDGILSVRLCHHIREPSERAQYVDELFRVARRWVVLTYFDHYSLKARLRRLKARFTDKREKWTMKPSAVADIAARHDFRVAESVPLSRLFSGHRYTVALHRDEEA